MTVADRGRKLLAGRRFSNQDPAGILRFLNAHRKFELTIEATAGYKIVRAADRSFNRVGRLAHPSKLRIIAQSTRMSDKLDATMLAEMLAVNQIPPPIA